MPRYAIVIADPEKHHAAEIDRNVKANLAHQVSTRRNIGPQETAALTTRIDRAIRARTSPPRDTGELHTVAETDCPDGLPNCRNCGDPAHKATCRKAGHCPHCGTAHGIAPDSYLAESGVELIEVGETTGQEWDRNARRFVPRA